MEVFTSMWAQISERFQDYDLRLIFEPSNEEWGDRFNDRTAQWSPDGGTLSESERYALLTELSQVFVDLIRSSGGRNPERFLLMKGYNTDVMKTVDNRFRLPEDTVENRLLLSVHYYTPWSYVGDRAGVSDWGTVAEVEEMNGLLARLTKFTEMGYGLVIGEWGVLDNDGDDRLFFFENFLDNCDLHGYAPMLWDTGGLFDRWATMSIRAPEIAELFLSRSVDAREGMSADFIIKTARDNMAASLERAANRPMFILGDDEAVAWIMFNSGDYSVSYSVGNRYRPEERAKGLEATDVMITGPGTYTVALDFTGTAAGSANGIAFSAVGLANGEDLFPGFIIDITDILINGQPAELTGKPYTSADDGRCTRVNLYNGWQTFIPGNARAAGGDLTGASSTPLADYISTRILTLEVTFDFLEP
jgi:endoglucanase